MRESELTQVTSFSGEGEKLLNDEEKIHCVWPSITCVLFQSQLYCLSHGVADRGPDNECPWRGNLLGFPFIILGPNHCRHFP